MYSNMMTMRFPLPSNSYDSILGYRNHYDNHGHKVGYTRDTLLGKKTRME